MNAGKVFTNSAANFSILALGSIAVCGSIFLSVPRTALAADPAAKPSAAPTAQPTASGAPQAEATPEKKIKPGVIASSTKTKDFAAIDVDTSGAAPGDEANPITASISHVKDDNCVAKVINNGEASYSVSFQVVGTDPRGSKPVNQTFSATIKPKGSVERTVSRCSGNLNLAVVLKSAKALK
ncbi:MAG: hypothetical protein U0136_14675 [Bdellovibrionota bacterium]